MNKKANTPEVKETIKTYGPEWKSKVGIRHSLLEIDNIDWH